ncbi:MAG: rhomboid family intramembrane serine protease [Flavisolibacter sp.]|jgi:membrane associated rhomboid family serine protease|nr:rhomboid family intramembrane serine protease [Flavisolibacter sp.]
MRYYQQQNKNRLTIGQDGNALTMLIAINLVVFVILAFIKTIYYFSYGNTGVNAFNQDIFYWVALPADMENFISRPWTLITHMFVHDTSSVWHILANMIWVWVFGYILQELAGNRRLFPFFFYGAIAGALSYFLAYNFIPPLQENIQQAFAVGASAGVMGIALGATTLAPGYRIFPMLNGGIPLWVITVIYLIIDLATIPYSNPGGHIAHLAGALAGFVVMKRYMRGNDWTLWMNNVYDWWVNLFNPDKPKKGNVVKSKLFYKATVQPFTKTPTITQQKVDEILEKIHQKGYSSLNEDEKEVLKRASQDGI